MTTLTYTSARNERDMPKGRNANEVRTELLKRIAAAGEPEAAITPIHYYA
ncbi:MAG: hypothetical protein ACP5E2_06580 [Terracidiphilus sp.]